MDLKTQASKSIQLDLSANEMAESGVKTAKKLFETALHSKIDPWLAILAQGNMRSEGMLTSPAQHLFACKTRGLLPLFIQQPVSNTSLKKRSGVFFSESNNESATATTKEPIHCNS